MTPGLPSSYCIALQPICDTNQRHVADELLYRNNSRAQQAVFDSDVVATARVCNAAFYEIGLEALVGQRKLFFNAPREWLLDPDLLPPPSPQVVIEVLESVEGDAQVMAALGRIRRLGYTLALDDFVLNERTAPLLDVAHIIKVDLLAGLQEADLAVYRARNIQLLAEKVEDSATFERCKSLGFTLFQGYFFARPSIQKNSERHRRSNRAAQVRLLNGLQQPDPDFSNLETLLVQDPELCMMLLRTTNSVVYRRSGPVTSIRHALMVLGLNRLRSLVTTLLLARNGPGIQLLLPQALTRAAMCENLALELPGANQHAAFTVGIFSMLDQLLGDPLESLLQQVALEPDVQAAILRHEGPLGQILQVAIAHEQGQLADGPAELVDKMNLCYLRGRAWANTVLRDAGA